VVNAILDPTGGAARIREDVLLASPRARLRGATIGLLENTKQNASLFLDEVGKLLVERFGVAAVVPRTKFAFALPMPDELLDELAGTCQAVVVGVGDCGSCSGSAVADGVALERRGIPAAVICTEAFTVTADAMAALKGATGYEYATTGHPVAVLTPDEVRERAEQALPRVVTLLTGGDREGSAASARSELASSSREREERAQRAPQSGANEGPVASERGAA